MNFYPPYKDEGEVVAAWGEAQLIRYLDGKTELKGGSEEDRLAAQEWISLFWHEGVVREGGRRASDFGGLGHPCVFFRLNDTEHPGHMASYHRRHRHYYE